MFAEPGHQPCQVGAAPTGGRAPSRSRIVTLDAADSIVTGGDGMKHAGGTDLAIKERVQITDIMPERLIDERNGRGPVPDGQPGSPYIDRRP